MKGRGRVSILSWLGIGSKFMVFISCFINEAPILPPEYNTTLNKIVSRHAKNTEFSDWKNGLNYWENNKQW
jgi:hypothetical protein